MAQKTYAELAAQAAEIKDETTANANTATRVGTLFEDINDSIVSREFNRAWSAELLFDKNEIHYAEHELNDDVVFSVAASGNLSDQFCSIVQEITTDGTFSISFEGFKYVTGNLQSGDVPEAGTYPVAFIYFNGVAWAVWSAPSSQTSNLIPLSTPANFVMVVGTDPETEIDATWDVVANATSITIELSTSASGPWILPITLSGSATSYTRTGLSPNTAYYQRVRAIGDLITFANSQYATTNATTESSGDVTAPNPAFTPANAATDIPVNRSVVIDFDEAIRNTDGSEITDANVAALITAKEDTSGGSDIPFTATINAGKNQITVTPDVVWGDIQVVYIAVNNFEDVNGNEETTPQSITFTTNDYAELVPPHGLSLGNLLDSYIFGADKNFEIEGVFKGIVFTSATVGIIFQSDPVDNQRAFVASSRGDDARFAYLKRISSSSYDIVEITWADAFLGFTSGKVTFKYFGAIDTTTGKDRAQLFIDDVEITAGKTHTQNGFPFDITGSTAPFLIRGATYREGKNFKFRNNMGATTIVDIPNLRTGIDVSGNGLHGTWV